MIKTRFNTIGLLTLWLGSTGLLWAEALPTQTERSQRVTFYRIGGQGLVNEFSQADQPIKVRFNTTTGIQAIVLAPGQSTQAFVRAPEASIRVFAEEGESGVNKSALVTSLAETPVPSTWSNILVLIDLNEANGLMTLQAINQSLAALPAATISFYNQTRIALTVEIGTSRAIIEPRKHAVLPLGLSGESASMVRIQVAAEVDGQIQLVSSGSYALEPKDRRIVLLGPKQNNGIRITLLDSVPAERAETANSSIVR